MISGHTVESRETYWNQISARHQSYIAVLEIFNLHSPTCAPGYSGDLVSAHPLEDDRDAANGDQAAL